jgi:hypothetical protein
MSAEDIVSTPRDSEDEDLLSPPNLPADAELWGTVQGGGTTKGRGGMTKIHSTSALVVPSHWSLSRSSLEESTFSEAEKQEQADTKEQVHFLRERVKELEKLLSSRTKAEPTDDTNNGSTSEVESRVFATHKGTYSFSGGVAGGEQGRFSSRTDWHDRTRARPESFGENTEAIQREIVRHVEYTLACPPRLLQQPRHAFRAVASSLRDRMWERYNDTEQAFDEAGARRLCYLSIEFLMGRALCNSVQALGLTGA